MKKLLPILIALLGIGAGIGAGIVLRPDPEKAEANGAQVCAPDPNAKLSHDDGSHAPQNKDGHGEEVGGHDYVKLNNQFVVPVVQHETVASLVIISLNLEVQKGQKESVFSREPKLRDAFLQVLFDHANLGGFKGAFTNSGNLTVLRSALLEVAREIMGDTISDVLITDIARQDV